MYVCHLFRSRSFYGPHIAGDSLDVVGNEILTGSWRNEHQVEIWDLRSGDKISEVSIHISVYIH